MKKSVLAIMVGALCIILSSCQETPEESSVVSKVDGISEAAVCEPLKKGEKRETNVPTHWKFEEKKSKRPCGYPADIKLDRTKQLAIFQVHRDAKSRVNAGRTEWID